MQERERDDSSYQRDGRAIKHCLGEPRANSKTKINKVYGHDDVVFGLLGC